MLGGRENDGPVGESATLPYRSANSVMRVPADLSIKDAVRKEKRTSLRRPGLWLETPMITVWGQYSEPMVVIMIVVHQSADE